MKGFECLKCGSKNTFIKPNGNSIGLYCGDCGKWIKWLSKEEVRIYEEQQKQKVDISDNKIKGIQCAACGFLDDEKSWYNSSLHTRIKICPKCGTLRFVHDNNKEYRK